MLKKLPLIAITLILAFQLISCENKTSDEDDKYIRPEKFLSQEELIDAMVDFRIAEAAIRQIASKGENTNKITPYYYKPMLEKHGLTIQDYHANLDYYANYPDEMDEIYKEVVNRLIEIQTDVRSQ